MATTNIGITAMELFAYNPYRVFGLPVNSTIGDIEERYDELIKKCNDGTMEEYVSEFDAPYLPPIHRNEDSISLAKDKFSSNGYRAFAYADKVYAISHSHADVSVHVDNIDCYDCFLSCYVWLVINDRSIMYKSLWFKLAKYIDQMICSAPEEWKTYFDSRFPEEQMDDSEVISNFYTTFCEIILLPLKELVKGSMECQSAVEVLSVKVFENMSVNGEADLATLAEKAEEAEKLSKRVTPRNPSMKSISLEELDEADEEINDDEYISLVDTMDTSKENIYNDALLQMLKANKARNQVIKELDTDKIFGSGNLGKDDTPDLIMQPINMSTKDETRLRSPYGFTAVEDMTLEEKYSNVSINDMLNPSLPYTKGARATYTGGGDEFDEHLSQRKTGQKLFIVLTIVFSLAVIGYICYLNWDEIVDVYKNWL